MKVPATPPPLLTLLDTVAPARLGQLLGAGTAPTAQGRYLHWDELRRRTPPDGLSRDEWWLLLKLARLQGRRPLPLSDVAGDPFTYVLTDEALSLVHRIDAQATGRIEVPEVITNEVTRDRYLVSSLMEEAISSSLLEGAATTRREAKELLRSGRTPHTRAELMVVNNFRTMQLIRRDLSEPLSLEMILGIHRTVTEGTLDRAEDAGRIQQPGERRVDVGDPRNLEVVLHRPPPAEQLPALLKVLVHFGNDVEAEPFVHPVVRAVALHFFLSYLHPFVDGNGRTARALFYRSMLRQGYWLVEFISISRLLYEAPARYARSFLHTETDDADFTYFLLHELEVIWRAIGELLSHLEARVNEVRQVERALRSFPGLNHRQVALLSHALRHPEAVYTYQSHRNSHNVVYQTARTDLLDLEQRRLLERRLMGREYRFYPIRGLADMLLGEPT